MMLNQKPPENLGLSGQQIEELFPFHLLIGEQLELLSIGSAIGRELPAAAARYQFDDYFSIDRPVIDSVDFQKLCNLSGRLCFVKTNQSTTTLRGQFVVCDPQSVLFLGTLLITAPDTLDNSAFSLRDFKPFDNTPELLILHRFREMQLRSIKQSSENLRRVYEAKDKSDKNANTDVLTGILNRRGFWDQAASAMAASDAGLALVLLDLDGFKSANDDFGHEAGDEILCLVANALKDAVGDDGVVGRLGGDEFVALFPGKTVNNAARVEDLVAQVKERALDNSMKHELDISAGVVNCKPGMALEQAVRCADLAMYAGRRRERGKLHWYNAVLQQRLDRDRRLTADLALALHDKALVPFYQPVVDIRKMTLIGFEVLARWEHDEFGFIGPDEFLPLAEQAGMLQSIDEQIRERALDQLQQWNSIGKDYRLHVNICGKSLTQALPDAIRENLESRRIDPSSLIIELTETTLIDNPEHSVEILERVAKLGVQIQLDDFGTGYSSLTHLQDYPVTGLKIDRSFVAMADTSERARNLLCGIVDIARRLELELVGEGIETETQLQLLQKLGCDHGQGYYLGRPAPSSECETGLVVLSRAA